MPSDAWSGPLLKARQARGPEEAIGLYTDFLKSAYRSRRGSEWDGAARLAASLGVPEAEAVKHLQWATPRMWRGGVPVYGWAHRWFAACSLARAEALRPGGPLSAWVAAGVELAIAELEQHPADEIASARASESRARGAAQRVLLALGRADLAN